MAIEADTAEEQRGGRVGVRHLSGIDFGWQRTGRLARELSQRREIELVVRMLGNGRPLHQEYERDERDRHNRTDNDKRDSQKAPHQHSLRVQPASIRIAQYEPAPATEQLAIEQTRGA